jgi:hypothetical protein
MVDSGARTGAGERREAMLKSRIMLTTAAAVAALALPAAASAAGVKLTATLTGANETGGGDPDGSGTLSADVDAASGDFCYTLTATGTDTPVAAHVHSGAAGADGPPVITLAVTGEGDDECVAVEPDTLKAILAAPQNYYVNVHTAAMPKGALRGQLANGK